MNLIRNEADIDEGLARLVEIDPFLAPVIAAAGPVPLRLHAPGFEGLAYIVVSQMISKTAANAIWARMEDKGAHSASGYLACSPELVASFGLSRAKAATLEGAARAIMNGDLDLDGLSGLSAAEAIGMLTALKGIGRWTAEVYLMFCLGERDVFPAGDVALRAAVGHALGHVLGHALGHEVRPSIAEVESIATRWKPYRAVAARLFWAYYATCMGRNAIPIN
ncbi:DNA-3-methyladenine glycosylase [Rhizobium lemnae]|uniref:DNA-3-methyladenine glycosylase II n=1 Tax=Rhizobium lemnae TaxID=1214924 RepID=A0ABV8E677_9HYPH|nr:DNA-3-methyladenine glycosylase [Rhizobium lemnae]MCJ8506760.1 DNA-3-methyladenine glycosylase [Rhizobium lemnae]